MLLRLVGLTTPAPPRATRFAATVYRSAACTLSIFNTRALGHDGDIVYRGHWLCLNMSKQMVKDATIYIFFLSL